MKTIIPTLFLRVSSWNETHGHHFYGALHHRHRHAEAAGIKHIDDLAVEAKITNQSTADALSTRDFRWKIGDTTIRFMTLEALQLAAIELCKRRFPHVKSLICGDASMLDPQLILFGPPEFEQPGNFLCDLFVAEHELANDGYTPTMEAIFEEWRKLCNSTGVPIFADVAKPTRALRKIRRSTHQGSKQCS